MTPTRTPTRVGAYAAGLAILFGAAYGTGQVLGPDRPDDPGHGDRAHSSDASAQPDFPGGLLVSSGGYTLEPAPAAPGEFAFRVVGPNGAPVTGYDVNHEKQMHLIVARRDLTGYRHLHPVLGGDGTWRVSSPLDQAGSWRAFADFRPTGSAGLTLGLDLAVPGTFTPRPLPVPAVVAEVDGYRVRLDGALVPGETNRLTLTVELSDGRPVTDLAPYLGSYGHLVALRAGDLAYLHVHPVGTPNDGRTAPGPAVEFDVAVPSIGSYRFFLDFQHRGVVRTAEFTMLAGATTQQPASGPATSPGAPSPSAPAGHDETGHSHD